MYWFDEVIFSTAIVVEVCSIEQLREINGIMSLELRRGWNESRVYDPKPPVKSVL